MEMIRRAIAALSVTAAVTAALRAAGGVTVERQSGGWRPLEGPDLT
jgi:hypothetical protein|tara:strand:+ start:916 stop:1053 length:138 start_codon:yes stop_codon:yes gene_type:complete